ncbi:MAG: potassium channel protein [Planctomycetota bacterium]|nr:potassium channel protein [Planctomycetota bacterium]
MPAYVRVVRGVVLLLVWMVVGTAGYSLIEGWSILDALYMTVITISTVGFMEVNPLTDAGRLFTIFLVVAGIGTALYTITRIGQILLEGELVEIMGRRRMQKEIAKLREHMIVCGFGRVGQPVAVDLHGRGMPFCLIEGEPALLDEIGDAGFMAVSGDATDADILREAGIEHATTLFALLATDADNLYLTMAAKELNPNVKVIARALDEKAEVRLKRIGADKVVSPYKIAGTRMLQAALKPTVLEFLELATHREYLPLSMEEIRVRDGSMIDGKTVVESAFKSRYDAIIVAIKQSGGEMVFNPKPDEMIHQGDILVTIGKEGDLKQLVQDCRAQ